MGDKKAEKLKGLLTAILTPFDLDGRLALEHMPAMLEFQRQAGVNGVVVCGTNGEGTSLSVAERKSTLETVMAYKNELLVIAGTGAANLPETLELTRHASEAGADAVLVMPPFFVKSPSDQGLADYFLPVLDATDIPVLLYNIPQFTAVAITDELLNLLAGHPNLVGVKDSAGDWARTSEFITRFPQLRIFAGSDRIALNCYTSGGAGCISGGANPFPEVVARVRDTVLNGSYDESKDAQRRLSQMIEISSKYPLIGSSKSILANRGLPRLGVRPPLINLSAEQENRLLRELIDAEFLIN